nr:EOG090X0F8Z [Lepidurus arcticus]
MVYIHFPSSLTEEELMLQAKYQKLKKKKKALQAMKAPKPEVEKTPTLKHPAEARDAREVAKKLIKSGAISAIIRPPERHDTAGFKRSRGLERKLSASDRVLAGFQPFSASQGGDSPAEEPLPDPKKPKVQSLYDTFVPSKISEGLTTPPRKEESLVSLSPIKEGSTMRPDKPKSGHTIYVFGFDITEDLLKKTFQPFGHVVNISMEVEKNCGFVTFDKVEAADKAIADVNGTTVGSTQLKVSLARRQPVIEPINDASSSTTWSTIGTRKLNYANDYLTLLFHRLQRRGMPKRALIKTDEV